jgi:hypothetical protein
MPEPHLRASDSDRAAVASALGEHMAAGRLTLAEYEERLTRVYETKTFGGLAALTADLPGPAPAAVQAPTRPAPAGATAPRRHGACAGWGGNAHAWEAWRRTAIIVLTIWALTSLASWDLIYFWPMWVLGPWGAVLLAQTVTGGHPDNREEKQQIRA